MDALYDILRKNKLKVERIGIDAVRGGSDPTEPKKKPIVIEFTPKGSTELDKPKLGKATDKAHVSPPFHTLDMSSGPDSELSSISI
jgi:hypothetical protein